MPKFSLVIDYNIDDDDYNSEECCYGELDYQIEADTVDEAYNQFIKKMNKAFKTPSYGDC